MTAHLKHVANLTKRRWQRAWAQAAAAVEVGNLDNAEKIARRIMKEGYKLPNRNDPRGVNAFRVLVALAPRLKGPTS